MIGLDFETLKKNFFDRAAVKNSVDASVRRTFSKFGAFVRQRAKTSIRKRKGTSPPGSPPYSQTGFLRKSIFFAFDRERESVVIGPTLRRAGSDVPKLLEHGGVALEGTKPSRHRPRPFMGPAFAAESEKLPDLWKNSLR